MNMPPKLTRVIDATDLFQSLANGTIYFDISYTPTYAYNIIGSGLRSQVFDDLSTMYERYVVLESKIVLDIDHCTNSSATALWCGVYPTLNNSGTLLGYIGASSNRKFKGIVVGSVNGTNVKRLTNICSSRDIFGVNPLFDQDYSGSGVTAPLKNWYWTFTYTADTAGASITCMSTVYIKIMFYNRKMFNMTDSTPVKGIRIIENSKEEEKSLELIDNASL